jgi:hypothetical protein
MFKIEIATENDAFKPDWTYETERILREVIQHIRFDKSDGQLYDINGNTVGSLAYSEE